MEDERHRMEAVLGGMRGRVPGLSRLALLPLAALALVCCVGLGILGFRLVAASGAFDVEQVEVAGGGPSSQLVRAAVLKQVGGQSLLRVDPGAVAATLAALPRVRSVAVDRSFPNTLSITVVPERAVAIAPTGDGRVVVAASGRILGDVTRGTMTLPVIAAAPSDIPGPGGYITAAAVRQELAVAAAPRRGLSFQAIGYGADGLTGRTRNGLDIRFGDSADVGGKLKVARSVLRRASSGVQYVDVSVPAAPVMRQDTPDALTANAPVPTAPAVSAATVDDVGSWSAGASPAESIRTLFG